MILIYHTYVVIDDALPLSIAAAVCRLLLFFFFNIRMVERIRLIALFYFLINLIAFLGEIR